MEHKPSRLISCGSDTTDRDFTVDFIRAYANILIYGFLALHQLESVLKAIEASVQFICMFLAKINMERRLLWVEGRF